MHLRLFLFSTALLLCASSSSAFPQSESAPSNFTLQIASFPDTKLADRYIVRMLNAGEHPSCVTVELPGRGFWTRVFVGVFTTTQAARRYGDSLISRGIISEFLIKRSELNQAVDRPRRIDTRDSHAGNHPSLPCGQDPPDKRAPIALSSMTGSDSAFSARKAPISESHSNAVRDMAATPLPLVRPLALELAPSVETSVLPRPEPVSLAFRLIVGGVRTSPDGPQERGGLWISGDTTEALTRLRWIVGAENSDLLRLDAGGRVRLDKKLLAKASGLGAARVDDPLRVADYIASDEGILLIVQLTEGQYRYRLHIGPQAPTHGRSVGLAGGINLDTNFDSRINPHRKSGKKLDNELPPDGFDSLVAVNPAARWFNLRTNALVPVGAIAFHELAEAHAKLELSLDYLDQDSRLGAHAVALEREQRLKSHRPGGDIVLTAGTNRVLRTEQEIRLFYAEASGGISQR